MPSFRGPPLPAVVWLASASPLILLFCWDVKGSKAESVVSRTQCVISVSGPQGPQGRCTTPKQAQAGKAGRVGRLKKAVEPVSFAPFALETLWFGLVSAHVAGSSPLFAQYGSSSQSFYPCGIAGSRQAPGGAGSRLDWPAGRSRPGMLSRAPL